MEFNEHLIRGSSEAEADRSANGKEDALESKSGQPSPNGGVQEAGYSPTYADGVRAVLEILDKHRVDIEKALCYGNNAYTYDDICQKVIEGEYLFIPLDKSVMLCEVTVLPKFRAFHCYIAAGDLEELLTEGTTQLGVYAKKHKCKYISLTGRRGWEPHLKKQGWTAPLTVMYKEV